MSGVAAILQQMVNGQAHQLSVLLKSPRQLHVSQEESTLLQDLYSNISHCLVFKLVRLYIAILLLVAVSIFTAKLFRLRPCSWITGWKIVLVKMLGAAVHWWYKSSILAHLTLAMICYPTQIQTNLNSCIGFIQLRQSFASYLNILLLPAQYLAKPR